MTLNRRNIKSIFQKAITEAKSGISVAIACWVWAKENKFNSKWINEAEEQLSSLLGMEPHIFVKTCHVLGAGDMCRGAKIVDLLGISRCASVLDRFASRNQKKLIERLGPSLQLGKVTTVGFDREVAKLHREISKSGKRLSEQRKKHDNVEQVLRSENRRLKEEIIKLKTKNAKLEKENTGLKKQVEEIKSVFA